jgi:hypothetical protein
MNMKRIDRLIKLYKSQEKELKLVIESIKASIIQPTPQYIYKITFHKPIELNLTFAPYYTISKELANRSDFAQYERLIHKLQDIYTLPNIVHAIYDRHIIFRYNSFIHTITYQNFASRTSTNINLNLPFLISDSDWDNLITNSVFPKDLIID